MSMVREMRQARVGSALKITLPKWDSETLGRRGGTVQAHAKVALHLLVVISKSYAGGPDIAVITLDYVTDV